ncbi:hypothetical protein LSH36_379g01024 [Paralvinella palmiformis]|uniref:Methyltransferase domain-containing protein n=1 Tax=Paralvinella palmiformis TaxID=53620 RepID=A0AAD9N0J8_9ANNE|nr:hypothetical protein LSH36_379g01024 [Paralvinella palmiformis]
MARSSPPKVDSYFSECLLFLHKYEWIYDFQLTHFFTDRVWENIPSEWIGILTGLTIEELNQMPFGYCKKSWPDSFKNFLWTATSLTPSRCLSGDAHPISIDDKMSCGMSPKKSHEVCHVAAVINGVCKQSHCKAVVDVGSGLGYLSLVLSQQLGYRVLGIECQEARCRGAEARANKFYQEKSSDFESRPFSLKDDDRARNEFRKILRRHFGESGHQAELRGASLSHSQHELSAGSSCQLTGAVCNITNNRTASSMKIVSEKDDIPGYPETGGINCSGSPQVSTQLQNTNWSVKNNEISDISLKNISAGDPITERICLIGLHCCGDLTPTMLKLFTQSIELKALIVLGCCYHRMTTTTAEDGMFYQFPMSVSLKQSLQKACGEGVSWKITTFGLRLAAQETRSRWKSQDTTAHNYHQNNVIFRGILDLVLQREKIKMLKSRRKLISKEQCKDFETYIDAVLASVVLEDGVDKTSLKEKMLAAYSDHKDVLGLVEPFTCLQVVLQGVLESLILKDRQEYLLEHGLEAQLLPILDDNISPRNVAIVAYK